MSDFIVLIHSDGDGNPVATGPHLHWVVVTDNQHPVAVNQLSDGGAFPHADCGEASVRSILNSRGVAVTVVTIEHDAGAGSQGTNAGQLERALRDFGVASTVTSAYPAKNTPPFRTIMNPLFGRIETGEQAAYEKAYAGNTIVVANPAPKPAPVAPKPVAPVAPKPVTPAPAPVAPKPVTPAPTPVAPVAPTPVAPVAPTPVVPKPAPVVPVAPTPVTPAPSNPFTALLRWILSLFGKR